MQPDNYRRYIERIEKEEFPIFANEDARPRTKSDDVVWPPSHHFKPGHHILTKGIIDELINKGKIVLSVGCGPAHLEQLLVRRLCVDISQISLADLDEYESHRNFTTYKFNMYGQWSAFPQKFDFVIFPESVLLTERFRSRQEREDKLHHLFYNSLGVLNLHGEVRINGHTQLEEEVDAVARRLFNSYPKTLIHYHGRFLLTAKKEV